MIKSSTHQEDHDHRHALSSGGPQYINKILTDFERRNRQYKRFLKMNKSSRQKISKELLDLNYTLDQMYLTDVNSTAHLTAAEYIFPQVHTEYSPR